MTANSLKSEGVLPDALRDALDLAAATPRLLITSDFDGTLAPIVNNPGDARPLPAAGAALVALAGLPDTTTALISGRARAVLDELAALPDSVHLIGSHGAEFDTGFVRPIDTALLDQMITTLRGIAEGRPGVTVETKPASVALHVRNASAADGESALAAARAAATSWDAHQTAGKAVLEFAVIVTDKGEAVEKLRALHDCTAAVFLGDDITDEKAFARLRDGDIGVKVGAGDTLAEFRVETPEDVAEALRHLADARGRLLA